MTDRYSAEPRKQLNNLYHFGRPPSLAKTTTREITDVEVGLAHDPAAQTRAMEFVTASLAFRARQATKAMQDASVEILDGIASELTRLSSKPKARLSPVAVYVALPADDDDLASDLPVADVVGTLNISRGRFDG